jgi:hypothetical protein
MMEKIPVGQTIAQAYGFAIREFPKILGVTWAPLAVAIALGLMITPGFIGNHINPNDEDAMTRFSMQMAPVLVLILLPIRAMIATGVTELALGMRQGVTFVYFSVGMSIWRFIASWILVVVAMVVLLVATAIVGGILIVLGGMALGHVLHGANAEISGVLAAAAFLLFSYGVAIFLAARLTFFIPAVVVAERKIDLARVWQLSHGNFWRIFLIALAIVIPVAVILAVELIAMYGADAVLHFFSLFASATHGASASAVQAQFQAWSETVREKSLAVWPCNAVFQLLFGTLTYGLFYGASAFAYRAIAPGQLPRD